MDSFTWVCLEDLVIPFEAIQYPLWGFYPWTLEAGLLNSVLVLCLISFVLLHFSGAVIRYPEESNSRARGFMMVHSWRLQSIIASCTAGKSWLQKPGITGQPVSAFRKQRMMNGCAQVSFSPSFSSGSQPRGGATQSGCVFPHRLINVVKMIFPGMFRGSSPM